MVEKQSRGKHGEKAPHSRFPLLPSLKTGRFFLLQENTRVLSPYHHLFCGIRTPASCDRAHFHLFYISLDPVALFLKERSFRVFPDLSGSFLQIVTRFGNSVTFG